MEACALRCEETKRYDGLDVTAYIRATPLGSTPLRDELTTVRERVVALLAKLNEANDRCALVATERDQLREKMKDADDSYRSVVNGTCFAGDELHCSCVPALREEIKRTSTECDAESDLVATLQAELNEARAACVALREGLVTAVSRLEVAIDHAGTEKARVAELEIESAALLARYTAMHKVERDALVEANGAAQARVAELESSLSGFDAISRAQTETTVARTECDAALARVAELEGNLAMSLEGDEHLRAALREELNAAVAEIATERDDLIEAVRASEIATGIARSERDAYRKAKQENDERFQNAATGQRERAEAAEARVAELEAALSGMLSRDSFGCSCDEPALGVCRWHALTARAAALVKGSGR